MPKPTELHFINLGPLVKPFERTNFKSKILEGEDLIQPFISQTYNATENSLPENVLFSDKDKILSGNAESSKYLWIIDEDGLIIIPEQTQNELAGRQVVCHTNITGGKPALQGGELWFDKEGTIYINNKSGRYGASTLNQREAILDYFRFVGYKNIVQLSLKLI
jgi:hypothetical protein